MNHYYIISHGIYSDHEVMFVACDYEPKEDVIALLAAISTDDEEHERHNGFRFEAYSSDMSFLSRTTCMLGSAITPSNFFKPGWLKEVNLEEEKISHLIQVCGTKLMRYLIAQWRELDRETDEAIDFLERRLKMSPYGLDIC